MEFVTYIGGDGYSAPVVLKSNGTTQEYLYLHRDYLGSIVAITNQAGNIVEKRLFDAWGEVLKVVDGQGTILTAFAVLDRGYTGHEHLQSVGLVHMNGRLYDAKLHRFLQPDNNIQDPSNTQNYNRYGYVLNNPLKYNDPSGENGETPGGLTNAQQTGLGATIASLAASWDELGIKDWFNDEFSNGFKSAGNWLSNNAKSANGWIDRNLRSIGNDISNFLFGKKQEAQGFSPPQFNQAQVNNSWMNNGFQNGGSKFQGFTIDEKAVAFMKDMTYFMKASAFRDAELNFYRDTNRKVENIYYQTDMLQLNNIYGIAHGSGNGGPLGSNFARGFRKQFFSQDLNSDITAVYVTGNKVDHWNGSGRQVALDINDSSSGAGYPISFDYDGKTVGFIMFKSNEIRRKAIYLMYWKYYNSAYEGLQNNKIYKLKN